MLDRCAGQLVFFTYCMLLGMLTLPLTMPSCAQCPWADQCCSPIARPSMLQPLEQSALKSSSLTCILRDQAAQQCDMAPTNRDALPVAPEVKMQVNSSAGALHMASTRRLASCSAAMELRSPTRSPCRLCGLLYRLAAMSCTQPGDLAGCWRRSQEIAAATL